VERKAVSRPTLTIGIRSSRADYLSIFAHPLPNDDQKSTCFNLRKTGFDVTVLSDCVTNYDKRKIPEMLAFYEKNGCKIMELSSLFCEEREEKLE
jgi:hypothetical protein